MSRWANGSLVRLTEEAYAMRLLGSSDWHRFDKEALELLRRRGGRVSATMTSADPGRVGISFGEEETRFTSRFFEDEFEEMTQEEYLSRKRSR